MPSTRPSSASPPTAVPRPVRRPARRPVRRITWLLAAVAVPVACGGDGTGPVRLSELVIVAGDGQRGVTGASLPGPLVISAIDGRGSAVGGISVTWAVRAGLATLSATGGTTDPQGLVSVTLTPDGPGEIGVTASAAGVAEVLFIVAGYVEVEDPTDDTFEGGALTGFVPPDVTRMRAWPELGRLVVELEFTDVVVSDRTGGPNSITGVVDIDIDQSAETGFMGFTDFFNPRGPSSGMGVDYFVDLATGPTGTVTVRDARLDPVGSLLPAFDGNVLTLRIPLSVLGEDEGWASLAAVVGSPFEPTDVVPDGGSLVVDAVTARSVRSR